MAMNDQAQASLQQMTAKDPKIQDVVNNSYAYAIFPEVGSAAVGVGGASGNGIVYRNGQVVGTAKLDQGSVGLQVGGETYSELIVFKDQDAYNRFTNGNLNFGAQTSATIVKAGAGGAAPFENGVAIYILPKGGLEAGVSVNGQKLTFHPAQQQ
jgi:lipid-binding SYLF domain-containing protein